MNRVIQYIEHFLEENRTAIVVLMLLVAVTGVIAGYRYYRYTRQDPQFCASCHMMQESYRNWEMSRHRDVICQKCHNISLLEQNRLFIAYVVKGYTAPREQKHGRVEPWKACEECHVRESRQGSLSLRKSFGHARHVFMENLGCVECHSASLHNFTPDEKACSGCHQDKLVHGLGMEGLSCLKCHTYSEEATQMVSTSRCLGCHRDVPTSGTMAGLECFDCHKPHGRVIPESSDCLGRCHGNEATVGQHGLHMERAGLGCLDCHKAHSWMIGKEQARGLCDRCHPLKDPRTFIY